MDREIPMDSVNCSLEYSDNTSESKYLSNNNEEYSVVRVIDNITESTDEKASKHSSKKQSKRRRKNSNHTSSRPLPRIIVKPLPPPPSENREWSATVAYSEVSCSSDRPSTMREVLASIPGFCIKPRKRSSKKLSTAAQLQQTKEGCIDLETPDSILVNTNIRALLNKHTFSLLPPLYQYKLGQLLPSVDRPSTSGRLSSSSLNNEFFARACLDWQDSLSGGEFTPENQQKMKTEAEKEKSKIDPWKLKHFEPIWGEKLRKEKASINLSTERPSLKTTIKLRPTASITSSSTVPKIKKSKSSSSSKRLRSVGAVTRSSTKIKEPTVEDISMIASKSSAPVPDLLPLNHVKNNSRGYIECADFNFSDTLSNNRLDDSISATPVDPLLINETEPQVNDTRESLGMPIVTIKEPVPSSAEIEHKADSESISEGQKRLSDENEAITFAKRFKGDDDNMQAQNMDNTVTNVCSDGEVSCVNEIPSLAEAAYTEQEVYSIDTNSDDSKATNSLYEYEEQSISSASSIRNEKIIDDASSAGDESIKVIIKLDSENEESVGENEKHCEDVPSVESPVYEKNDSKIDLTESCEHSENEYNFEIQNEPCFVSEKVQIEDKIVSPNNSPKLEYQNLETESTIIIEEEHIKHIKPAKEIPVQNYYDEHFKDAESLILETGGITIITSKHDDDTYVPHSNIMELSSYMNEAKVTAVVSMPLTHTSSIPGTMVEVTNSSLVTFPDENMQDATKPKKSAMAWRSNSDWANDNVVTLHAFTTADARYINEDDTKTSMEDGILNDDFSNKDDRDSNFNMESSNSSESSQSVKEVSLKSEVETVVSIISSTSTMNTTVNTAPVTQSTSRSKKKSAKESSRNRSSKVPPGAVNLERSYQICQAVIQNSPNRDALRNQLRPPPALLTKSNRAPRTPVSQPQPQQMLMRQVPITVVPHTEINDTRVNNMGQYILLQRSNVAPRASSAPPANQNVNVAVGRCRSAGSEDACVCNLRAMVLCKKCGAFCHDDCIGAPDLCFTCLIR